VGDRNGELLLAGTYEGKRAGHWWLVLNDRGDDYWPQHKVQFDAPNKTWYGSAYAAKRNRSSGAILLVQLSDDLNRLAEYYGHVHEITDQYVSTIMKPPLPRTFKILDSASIP
jgi:hypothetical protein